MVGQIPGKMFDHPIEKDCVQIYPIRQLAGPESDAIKNLAVMHMFAGMVNPGVLLANLQSQIGLHKLISAICDLVNA